MIALIGQRIEKGMLPEKDEKAFIGKRVTKDIIAAFDKAGIDKLTLRKTSLLNRVFGKDVIDPETGEILIEQGQVFTEEHYELFKKFKTFEFDLIQSSGYVFQPTIAMTLDSRSVVIHEEDALKEVA